MSSWSELLKAYAALFYNNRVRLAISFVFAALALHGAAPALAITDVNVVDVASGTTHSHMTVVINEGKITAVAPFTVGRVPAATHVIDGKGKFLIPGLWDMHVHLFYKEYLPTFVAFGVTGVQDMGSDFSKVREWRSDIEKEKAIGPRIITSGPPVDGAPSGDPKLPVLVVRTPEDARKAFDALWNMDVDFVKVLSRVPRDAYFALAEQARHWDLRMVGHIPASVTAQEAVEARQKSLEHLFGVMKSVSTEDEAIKLFERCALMGTRISPTLVLWLRMSHMDDPALMSDERLRYVPHVIRKTWPDVSEDPASVKVQVWRAYRLTALAKRAKVEILAGTDTGDPYTIPGGTLHDELEQLVAAGLTPRDALEAATLAPARFFEADADLGAIAKGKLADMVLLDSNPLEDIRNVRKISGVVSRGKFLARKDLDAILDSSK